MADAPVPTVYLVDGTYTVFRSYYAISRLSAPDGRPTNAVYGFLATVRKIVRERDPKRLAIAFDLEGPTHRDERYAQYKANREPPPEDLVPQLELAVLSAEALGWSVVTKEGYEADDVIAALAAEARDEGLEVVVVTADKDLYQLVGDGVYVLNPMKGEELLDAAGIERVFGVQPERVPDVLALMGDAVDNVPGVPGVGEKTAKALVRRYGSLEAVLERARHFARLMAAQERGLAAVKEKDAEGLAQAVEALAEPAAALVEIEGSCGGDEAGDLIARFAAARDLAPDAAPREAGKVLRDLAKKTQPKSWLAIAEHEEQARLSEELVTISAEMDLAARAEELTRGVPDYPEAIRLFRELGFRTLTAELEEEAERRGEGVEADTAADGLEVALLDAPELGAWVDEARAAGDPVAFDTETTSLEPRRARLVGIALAREDAAGAYVPLGHASGPSLDWEEARKLLAPLFEDSRLLKVGQNLKYDLAVLRGAGLVVRGPYFDTLVASQMADAGRSSSHKLDDLARRYLGQAMISYGQVSAGDEGERTLDLVSAREVARYAVEDACVARRLMPVLQERLDELELRPLFEEVEAPLVAVLEEMEHDGILIDEERLAAMARRMHGELERLEREIHDLAGRPFNIKSPQQLRGVLFDELGLSPSGRRTQKTKVHSTGQEVLEALSEKHPLPGKVLEYRELAKLVGTYVEALPKLIDERDGRLHTRFHQLGAATGRLSSSDPNLQNIPIRTRAGREIRQAFVPEEGRVFLSADYSQMELRILAHLARDEALIEAFRRDEDIHRFTAAAVMGLAPAEVTPELRSRAKAVNFGIVYGMSEFRLAREQGMSREEARAFIDAYFARYGRLRRYVESVHESVQETGVVRTLLGRVRHFPELLARGEESPGGRLNRMTREALLRQAVNTTVQGSGADIVKRAMVQLAERLHDAALPARLVLQVHDELLLEVEEGRVEEVARLVRDVMEGAVELAVPLRVETHAGRTWSDAH